MLRKVLFQVHLWAGLILGIPFLLLGFTGSILVFDQDILGAMREKQAVHATAGPVGSIDSIASAALAAAPNMRVTQITAPEKLGEPVVVRLQPGRGAGGGGRGEGVRGEGQRGEGAARGEGGQRAEAGAPGGARPQGAPQGAPPGRGGPQTVVSVDPVNFSVLRVENNPAPLMLAPIHQLHGNFSISGGMGRQLVGWAGVLMTVMGLSGLYLWWPKGNAWKRAFAIRKNARGYVFNRDLHGMVGIWLWAVFIVVTISGTYIAFPQQMSAMMGSMGARDLRATPQIEGGGPPVSLDTAYHAALNVAPDARLLSIAPAQGNQPIRVTLAQPGWQEGAPSMTAFINPADGAVVELRDPRKYSAVENIGAWMRALHEGSGVGLWYKVLVFLSGFMPPLFVITGLLMWLQKRKNKAAAAKGRVEPEAVPAE